MKSTKKLLSISNLKKYFPVAKSSIFQKEQLYVRANEDISIDIYEGETVGVVGESGCGKSTLGRVLLQLYPQTAGTTMYYGATLDSTTPKYVIDTLHHLDRYKARLEKASEKAAELSKKVMDAGGEENADFYLLQERNLALCDEQTCLMHIVTILGGFFAKDEGGKGRELMEKVYYENVKRNKLLEKRTDINAEYELSVGKGDSGKAAGLKAKLDELDSQIAVYDRRTAACQRELDDLRARNAANPEFAKYEAMRDSGIDLARLQYSEMRLLRKDLQIIFQDPYSSLDSRFTVGRCISEPLEVHKIGTAKERLERVEELMGEVGLNHEQITRYPHEFSGGQRQRIALARALAVCPGILVMDDTTSAVDMETEKYIQEQLTQLPYSCTKIIIAQRISSVKDADQILILKDGQITERGTHQELLAQKGYYYETYCLQNGIDPEEVNA